MAHAVEFYDDEGSLARNVARFVGDGAAAAEHVVLIARPTREASFRAEASGDFTFVNADRVLEQLMAGDMPDVERFLAAVEPLIVTKAPSSRCRIYGEMVDVLWRNNKRRAAIALEGLWNELARQRDFTLLCAYAAKSFRADRDSKDFDAVCWAHTRTVPSDITFASITRRAGTSA